MTASGVQKEENAEPAWPMKEATANMVSLRFECFSILCLSCLFS